jgi:hypothetical protein
LGCEVAGIDAFHDDDAGVLAQFPGELAAADVDGVDELGAVLEEAIREASGGGADIHGDGVGDVDLEGLEGVFEFGSAAADVAGWGGDFELVVGLDFAAGFIGDLAIEADGAGEDEALGLFAAGGEALLDEADVEAFAGGARRTAGVRRFQVWGEFSGVGGLASGLGDLELGFTEAMEEEVVIGHDALDDGAEDGGAELGHFLAIDDGVDGLLEGLERVECIERIAEEDEHRMAALVHGEVLDIVQRGVFLRVIGAEGFFHDDELVLDAAVADDEVIVVTGGVDLIADFAEDCSGGVDPFR